MTDRPPCEEGITVALFQSPGSVPLFIVMSSSRARYRIMMLMFSLSVLLYMVLPFLLPEKADTGIFDYSFFVANWIFHHLQYKCIDTSNITQVEE